MFHHEFSHHFAMIQPMTAKTAPPTTRSLGALLCSDTWSCWQRARWRRCGWCLGAVDIHQPSNGYFAAIGDYSSNGIITYYYIVVIIVAITG